MAVHFNPSQRGQKAYWGRRNIKKGISSNSLNHTPKLFEIERSKAELFQLLYLVSPFIVWHISWEKLCYTCRFETSGPNFMALFIAKFCIYNHHSLLTLQVPNFCASCVSKKCLVTWSTHAHQNSQNNPSNTIDVSKEFPAFASVDSLLTVSKAMKLGPPPRS